MKKLTVGQAKKRAWKLFSLYIKTRDCLSTTGTLTHGKCVTCKKVFPITNLEAGHFRAGHIGMAALDERNVHAQCRYCNCHLHSNKQKYEPEMLRMYGQEVINEIDRLKRTPCTWKVPDYLEFIDKVKKDIEYIKGL